MDKFVRQVEENRKELARKQRQVVDKFPAVLTGTANGAYAWTEQTWSATGTRYTKPGGRTGVVAGVGGSSVTYSPAYAYGTGEGPHPTTLPVEVMLRRTLVASDLGPVYEFNWNCACDLYSGAGVTYSGAGSGGSGGGVDTLPGVPTVCCPGILVPAQVFLTVTGGGDFQCVYGTYPLVYQLPGPGFPWGVWIFRYQGNYPPTQGCPCPAGVYVAFNPCSKFNNPNPSSFTPWVEVICFWSWPPIGQTNFLGTFTTSGNPNPTGTLLVNCRPYFFHWENVRMQVGNDPGQSFPSNVTLILTS